MWNFHTTWGPMFSRPDDMSTLYQKAAMASATSLLPPLGVTGTRSKNELALTVRGVAEKRALPSSSWLTPSSSLFPVATANRSSDSRAIHVVGVNTFPLAPKVSGLSTVLSTHIEPASKLAEVTRKGSKSNKDLAMNTTSTLRISDKAKLSFSRTNVSRKASFDVATSLQKSSRNTLGLLNIELDHRMSKTDELVLSRLTGRGSLSSTDHRSPGAHHKIDTRFNVDCNPGSIAVTNNSRPLTGADTDSTVVDKNDGETSADHGTRETRRLEADRTDGRPNARGDAIDHLRSKDDGDSDGSSDGDDIDNYLGDVESVEEVVVRVSGTTEEEYSIDNGSKQNCDNNEYLSDDVVHSHDNKHGSLLHSKRTRCSKNVHKTSCRKRGARRHSGYDLEQQLLPPILCSSSLQQNHNQDHHQKIADNKHSHSLFRSVSSTSDEKISAKLPPIRAETKNTSNNRKKEPELQETLQHEHFLNVAEERVSNSSSSLRSTIDGSDVDVTRDVAKQPQNDPAMTELIVVNYDLEQVPSDHNMVVDNQQSPTPWNFATFDDSSEFVMEMQPYFNRSPTTMTWQSLPPPNLPSLVNLIDTKSYDKFARCKRSKTKLV